METYAKEAGLWADCLASAQYERVLHFDLSTVVRTLAGPSNPHRRLPVADLAARGIAVDLGKARAQEACCRMGLSSSPPSPVAPTPATRAT